jgi:D-alanyl-lipoteichoic acid acyltransferase DltB (MBOAT superfamily)
MLFNSIPFLLFFSFVYLLYWNVPFKYRHSLLLFSGLIFYGYSSVPFLVHFLLVISINYFLYKQIHSFYNFELGEPSQRSKLYVTISVIFNVINLATFKYFFFFMNVLGDITGNPIFYESKTYINFAFPLAISFYSFQMIAAAVDTYRKPDTKPVSAFTYFLFVLFFPVLIAGPIMRFADFLPNLEVKEPEREKLYKAIFLLSSGLIKKILIADPVAGFIFPVYANPSEYSGLTLFMSGILYTLQVYCDFSGLTDMARSVGYFLGFKLPENFFAPFFSMTMRELWKRWHATFSLWLMNYIYFPLGGSRNGNFRTYINLLVTMTLGGFWHGANYTFIVWGFYMGSILCIERFLDVNYQITLVPTKSFILKVLKAFSVFLLFSISALMFRSNDWASLVELFKGIFFNHSNYLVEQIVSAEGSWLVSGMEIISGSPSFQMKTINKYENVVYMYVMFILFHYIQYKPERLEPLKKYSFPLAVALGVLTIFLLATMSEGGGGFIYNQF